ncbi:unnamed protein product [Rhizophagus irregularis]|nr:unnamed protein product [Rhizophagus irregularis]
MVKILIFVLQMDSNLKKLESEINRFLKSSENNKEVSVDLISKFQNDSYEPKYVVDTIVNYRNALKDTHFKFEFAFKLYYILKYYENNVDNYVKEYKKQIFGDDIININAEMKVEKNLHHKTILIVLRIFHIFNYLESKGCFGIYKLFKVNTREISLIKKYEFEEFIKKLDENLLSNYNKDLKAWSDKRGSGPNPNLVKSNQETKRKKRNYRRKKEKKENPIKVQKSKKGEFKKIVNILPKLENESDGTDDTIIGDPVYENEINNN